MLTCFFFYFSFDRSCCLALFLHSFSPSLLPSTPKRRLAARRKRNTSIAPTTPPRPHFHTHSSVCACNGCFTSIKAKSQKHIDAISTPSKTKCTSCSPVHLSGHCRLRRTGLKTIGRYHKKKKERATTLTFFSVFSLWFFFPSRTKPWPTERVKGEQTKTGYLVPCPHTFSPSTRRGVFFIMDLCLWILTQQRKR